MPAKMDEYKGRAVLSLTKTEGSKYPFSFGVEKAKLILQHIEEIKGFVENYAEELPDNKEI